ncbi:agamous-like MADS-box protein AGL23 [Vitis riparia]|uniref:agamous-like MADS-box protein AGL23 n=1 Tax=Vitis riparia TaxID=96939 RepID=UPI00155AE9D7|nr:agamous-like MADS-box protein AGL23 [Vitis riparia]
MEMANVNSWKKNMGRRKIEIRKIKKKSSLEVTFSKRRTGFFKKVDKLYVLCGAKVTVIVFSPGGRAFVFGYPIANVVVDRFLKCDTDTSSRAIGYATHRYLL